MAIIVNAVMIFLILHRPSPPYPMYFLLSHLSFIDILYISTIVPKMLADYLEGEGPYPLLPVQPSTFSIWALWGQFFPCWDSWHMTATWPSATLSAILSSWAIESVGWSWPALGLVVLWIASSSPLSTMTLPFCASHKINHFFCEAPTMLRLACGDKAAYEMVMYVCCVMMLLIPFSVVIASYTGVLITVHQMKSAEGKKKAFATCSSHMMVVILFYGACPVHIYGTQSYHTPTKDKVFSVFYTIITPC